MPDTVRMPRPIVCREVKLFRKNRVNITCAMWNSVKFARFAGRRGGFFARNKLKPD